MRKDLFFIILLLPAFCFVSCKDIDDTLISRAQEPVGEFSDDTILVSEKAASEYFNVFEYGGFLLTVVEKETKRTFSDGSTSTGHGSLFDFNYLTPKALVKLSIVSSWKNFKTYKFNLYYQEPAILFDSSNNYDNPRYYDNTIDYTPEGYIAKMGMKADEVSSGHTYAYEHLYNYSYNFSYDEKGRLIEINRILEEEKSTDIFYEGTIESKSTTDTKTTLTWEDDNITRVLKTTHYVSKNITENTTREYDDVSDYTITYSEDENPGRQYCLALSNLIMDNEILIPCTLIGLCGSGTRNVPVNISGMDSDKEFNQDILLTYSQDVKGIFLIETEQWPDESQDENNYTKYCYKYRRLMNSSVPKIYDN